MALTPIETVRLLIGDVEGSPFFPMFDDEDIQQFLDMNNGNVYAAARLAAISASFQLAGYNTRERVGDEEIWSSLSTQYMKALDYFINNPGTLIPAGLFPWSASTGSCSPLMNIKVCDGDSCKSSCNDGCACSDCCSDGPTFAY